MTGPGALAALTSTSTFAVLETDDPLAGYTDKIEQRFVAQQEPG